jgi:uncharacterized protein
MSLLLERYEEILERLRAELIAHYGPRLVSVAVFGSVGRGTPRQDSDIDVLIVARDLPRGRTARVEEFLPVEARVESWLSAASSSVGPLMLSPVFKTPAEVEAGSPLFLDMIDDARLLQDTGGFFQGFLDGFRHRLQMLGARRIWRGNAWYWELKPDLKPGEVFTL